VRVAFSASGFWGTVKIVTLRDDQSTQGVAFWYEDSTGFNHFAGLVWSQVPVVRRSPRER
jgi:hypothetical protein